jgi:hypothetical protein
MLVAARAVLLPLDALGVQALVLRGEVIAILTIGARENDLVAGHVKNLKGAARIGGSRLTAPVALRAM